MRVVICDLINYFYNIFRRWKNSLLLNVQGACDVWQMYIYIYITEPFVSECSPFDIYISIANLKMYKSAGIDQIPVELI
jgi:hypothetical protein